MKFPDDFVDQVVQGNALQTLRQMPDECVQTVITSPPYYGLRAYGTDAQVWDADPECEHEWGVFVRKGITGGVESEKLQIKGKENFQIVPDSEQAFCRKCGAWRGELGLEPTINLYIKHLSDIFMEVHRVLKRDGCIWINMGDSYAGGGATGISKGWESKSMSSDREKYPVGSADPKRDVANLGLKPKDLMGIPWRLAFELQRRGWWLRNDIIWSKPNAMPSSASDRCTLSHEYIFLLSKSRKYYYNAEAIKEDLAYNSDVAYREQLRKNKEYDAKEPYKTNFPKSFDKDGRKRRTVWTVPTKPFPEAHFATFPAKLIEPCVMAGSKSGDIVLDPFVGSGTTMIVAMKYGRKAIGLELNKKYFEMARDRVKRETAQRTFYFD